MKQSSVNRQRISTPLDKLLKRAKITSYDVCVHLKCTPLHLLRIKNDYVTNLTTSNLYKLSALLGLSAPQLLFYLERYKFKHISTEEYIKMVELPVINMMERDTITK